MPTPYQEAVEAVENAEDMEKAENTEQILFKTWNPCRSLFYMQN
jgi:hypothetical protein